MRGGKGCVEITHIFQPDELKGACRLLAKLTLGACLSNTVESARICDYNSRVMKHEYLTLSHLPTKTKASVSAFA